MKVFNRVSGVFGLPYHLLGVSGAVVGGLITYGSIGAAGLPIIASMIIGAGLLGVTSVKGLFESAKQIKTGETTHRGFSCLFSGLVLNTFNVAAIQIGYYDTLQGILMGGNIDPVTYIGIVGLANIAILNTGLTAGRMAGKVAKLVPTLPR